MEEYNDVTASTTPKPTTRTIPTTPMETPTAPADEVFSGYDKNSDSEVTTDELASSQAFARFDLDKDGAISLAEYNQVSGKTSPTATPGTATPPSPAVTQIDAMVQQFDVNADGKITREASAGAQWFNRVDSNADGIAQPSMTSLASTTTSMRRSIDTCTMPSALI